MIILFEDRKERKNVNRQKFDRSILKEASFDYRESNTLNTYIKTLFGKASVVLFHNSYKFTSDTITISQIQEEFKNLNIPLVIFGGGTYNNLTDLNGYYSGTMNSASMYQNLPIFLDNFKRDNKINLKVLIFGEDYLKNSLLKLQKLLYIHFFNLDDTFQLSSIEKEFIETNIIGPSINESELKNVKEEVISWLLNKDNTISVGILKNKISAILES